MSKLERFMRFAHPQVLVAHLLKLRRPRPEWIARGLSAKWPYGNSYQFAMGRRPELVHLVEPLLYSNDGYVVSSAISVIHDVKPELLVKHAERIAQHFVEDQNEIRRNVASAALRKHANTKEARRALAEGLLKTKMTRKEKTRTQKLLNELEASAK